MSGHAMYAPKTVAPTHVTVVGMPNRVICFLSLVWLAAAIHLVIRPVRFERTYGHQAVSTQVDA
jgi:hypothetical protein